MMCDTTNPTNGEEKWTRSLSASMHGRIIIEEEEDLAVTGTSGLSCVQTTFSPTTGSEKVESTIRSVSPRRNDANITRSDPQKLKKFVSVKEFNFTPDLMAQRRNIDRQIDFDEMSNVKYLCAGSNSHIFSAIWHNQNVIIKVITSSEHAAI